MEVKAEPLDGMLLARTRRVEAHKVHHLVELFEDTEVVSMKLNSYFRFRGWLSLRERELLTSLGEPFLDIVSSALAYVMNSLGAVWGNVIAAMNNQVRRQHF